MNYKWRWGLSNMRITIQQVKALDFNKLAAFIATLSINDLHTLSSKFDTFIESLFLNGLDNTDEYTKAIHIMIEIDNAIDELTKGNTQSLQVAK
jgi:hypothetical protein